MQKRYLYTLLFLGPGLLISLIVVTFVFGATTGFLWLFVFGDNTWPAAITRGLPYFLVLTFVCLWTAFIVAGFLTGKRLEADPVLNKKHLLGSIIMTIVFALVIILHQLSVGNIGKKHDSIICGDFCREKGFSTSGMPPRDSGDYSCICYDANGNEIIKLSMADIFASAPE